MAIDKEETEKGKSKSIYTCIILNMHCTSRDRYLVHVVMMEAISPPTASHVYLSSRIIWLCFKNRQASLDCRKINRVNKVTDSLLCNCFLKGSLLTLTVLNEYGFLNRHRISHAKMSAQEACNGTNESTLSPGPRLIIYLT